MTHYKMNSLHLGCGESLSTLYRRNEQSLQQRQNRVEKTVKNKRAKSTRQVQGS